MARKNKIQEPAQLSYFFGESYFDLGRTIKSLGLRTETRFEIHGRKSVKPGRDKTYIKQFVC